MSNHTHTAQCAFSALERAANEAATGNNCRPLPTPAQSVAGNYKMGRARVQGLDVRIENVRGSVRNGTSPDGKTWSNRMAAHYGYIAGTRGADGDAVDIFVGPFPESTLAWVINQGDAKGGFDEHKVMVGFAAEAQARDGYLHSYDKGWRGLRSIVSLSIDQLKWWLRHGNKAVAITPDQLPHEGEKTMDQVAWGADALPTSKPLSRLIYDMRLADSGSLLLDACTVDDLMTDPDIEGRAVMDAMVVEVGMLQRKMEQLLNVMKAASATVQPVDFTIADPVKMRGTMQIAVVFAMNDGQAVTVWFHNPDTTPAKLTPMDELVSWKWMLNKKDITIWAAPERGRDIPAREVARRVMKLADKNSEAFKRANARAADLAAQHAAIDAEIPVLEAELAKLKDDVEVARIAKGDGEVLPIVPSAVAPVVPAATEGEKSPQSMAQELAQVLMSEGYAAFSERRGKMMAEFDLSAREALDLGMLVDGIVGPEAMTLARAKFDPFTQGQKAWYRGESEIPPAGLSEEEAQQWIAGWADRKQNAEESKPDPVVEPGEVVGEATEVQPVAALPDPSNPLAGVPTTILATLDGTEVLSRIRSVDDDGEPIPAHKQVFDAAREYFRSELQGNTYKHTSIGDIKVNGSVSWGKVKRGLTYNLLRVKLLAAIPNLLRKGYHVGTEPTDKTRPDSASAFHHLVGWVSVGGLSVEVGVSLAEMEHGRFMYNLSDSPSALLAKKQSRIVKSGESPTDPALDSAAETAGDGESVAQDGSAVKQEVALDDAGALAGVEVLNFYVLKVMGADGQEVDDLADQEEGAEPVGELTPAQKVDEAYRFGQATDRFKQYIAETVADPHYSMFATAKAIDEAAKARGASVSWDVEEVAAFDSVEAALDAVAYSVNVIFNEGVPENQRQFGSKQTCFVDWGIYGGVALVEATDEDRAEFGGGTFRIGKGQTQYESIVRVDPKGMRLYFVDNKHYEDTMEVKWDTPVKLKRLVIQNKAKFEAAYRTPILDTATPVLDRLEAGAKLAAVGRIFKDGVLAGVATIAGDGKAIIYVGDLGGERVKDPNGVPAPRGSDPEYLVKWLLEPVAVVAPEPEPEPAPPVEDGNVAVLRSILAGESDSAHLSLTLATIEACVNALNDAGLLTGDVEQLAQDAITYWANLDEKVNG